MREREVEKISKLEKLENIINDNNNILSSLIEHQISLESQLQEIIKTNLPQNIAINSASKIDFIPIKNILYFTANLAYTNITSLNNDNILSSKSLNEFEIELINHSFFRVSKSLLVNINHVHSYNKRSGQVLMKNNALLDVARRKKADFITAILQKD